MSPRGWWPRDRGLPWRALIPEPSRQPRAVRWSCSPSTGCVSPARPPWPGSWPPRCHAVLATADAEGTAQLADLVHAASQLVINLPSSPVTRPPRAGPVQPPSGSPPWTARAAAWTLITVSTNTPHLSRSRIQTLTYYALICLHLHDVASTSEYEEGSRVVRHGIETLPTIAGSPPQRRPMVRLPSVPACALPEQRGPVAA